MSELFVNTIANSCAGLALFSLPNTDSTGDLGGFTNVVGFLAEDPVIQMKTNWEPVLPGATELSDWSQLASLGAVSWIASSKASWKGTDPITLSLNFYLLTYRLSQVKGKIGESKDPRNMPVSEQAARFAALLAVAPKKVDQPGAGKLADFGIHVHGNYRANYFEQNTNFTGNEANAASEDRYNRNFNAYNESVKSMNMSSDEDSTVNIVINGGGNPSQFFSKMLLADATFTPSPVRCGYWEKNVFKTSSEPLYIKVSATFVLAHTATVRDAVRMFTGKPEI